MSTSPSISPPRTPNEPPRRPPSTSPGSDESIEDLSFDYAYNEHGELVRTSRDGTYQDTQSTPPTPDEPLFDKLDGSPQLPVSPMARVSLSRSESAHAVLTGAAASVQDPKPVRSFQRVASGPGLASTPSKLPAARSKGVMPRRVTMEDHRERPEPSSRPARQTLELSSRDRESYTLQQEEKENILTDSEERPTITRRNSPPLVARSVTSRARISHSVGGNGQRPLAPRQAPTGINRPGRILKSSSSLKYSASNPLGDVAESNGSDTYQTELENQHTPAPSDTDGEDDSPIVEVSSIPHPGSGSHIPGRQRRGDLHVNVQSPAANRPRRSASLSDALQQDDYQLQVAPGLQPSRPGTSLGNNDPGARRVYPEERERQEMEARADYRKLRKENEGELDRHSPSPTHQQQSRPSSGSNFNVRPIIHRRRDSDTLRGLVQPHSGSSLGSPTVMEGGPRHSPTGSRIGRASPPGARGRASPQNVKGRASPAGPTGAQSRISPFTATAKRMVVEREAAKHRMSPTAPDVVPPLLNGGGRPGSLGRQRTWAAEERDPDFDPASSAEKDQGKERARQADMDRERKERRDQMQSQSQTQQPSQMQPYGHSLQASINQSQSGNPQTMPAPKHIIVNRRAYARLDLIGKGGSSRVFRVLNHVNELYAIKRVSLDKTDAETMSGYMNEIALLKRLEGNNRIIRLIDSEVKPGPGGSKGHLLLVMECGEVDFSRLLQEQMGQPLNMVWVSYYWQQMLQAVHVIHEEKIVHSDLKPANFVLVKGQLKLIDFGIANAIANDTTNIQRDHQIGTVNYMSPEAIELPDGMRRLKVGRPSDVWSLGIILYQMVYGSPPFQHLSVYQKMKAIPDGQHTIEYPDYAVPCIPVRGGVAGQPPQPPQRLEEHKRRVRLEVIGAMKSCLERQPKERSTIPELLDLEWLGLRAEPKEEQKSELKELLGPEETVINPHYMRQLLEYGLRMAPHQGTMDLEKEAQRLVAELRGLYTGQMSS